jgi:hypothetical protein
MKWLSPMLTRFGVAKIDRRATRPRIVMDVFSSLPDELTSSSHASNTVSVIGELCLKSLVNAVRVCLQEKPNRRSLLRLHSAMKI